MRAVALVLVAAVVLAGCGEEKQSRDVPDPFTVGVADDAASVARKTGVDLEQLVAESARTVFELLPHEGRIGIEVVLDPSRTIPGIGVGGFTDPGTGDALVSIEDSPPGGVRAALETWIPATVAHELHHSSRIRTGPGYGFTLAEALVTEGSQAIRRRICGARPSRSWTRPPVTTIERGFSASGTFRVGPVTPSDTASRGHTSAMTARHRAPLGLSQSTVIESYTTGR